MTKYSTPGGAGAASRHMRTHHRRDGIRGLSLLAMLAVGLVAMWGCGTESLTERARRSADPAALEHLVEAQKYLEWGYYNNALILADSAAILAPDLADIPFLRGRILTTMRQYDQAQFAYEVALDLDPDYPGVYLNLGNVQYLRGEPEKALNFYRKEKGAADSLDYLIQLGRAYADLGSADSARIAYEKAISTDSLSPTAYMWLGQLLEDQGEISEALQYSRKGLALRPDNLNYAYVVGVQLLRNEDLRGAAEKLRAVIDGMPWHYAAHYNLGQALNGVGDVKEGTRVLARADTLLKYHREITRWESLLATNSHEPMLWVNYGTALRTAGRTDDAIHALTVAFSLNPEWIELQNNIANLMLVRGDTLEALDRYQGLLAMDSTNADIWLNLGTVYALSGDYDQARAAWQTALRQDPEHSEVRQYLSQLPTK